MGAPGSRGARRERRRPVAYGRVLPLSAERKHWALSGGNAESSLILLFGLASCVTLSTIGLSDATLGTLGIQAGRDGRPGGAAIFVPLMGLGLYILLHGYAETSDSWAPSKEDAVADFGAAVHGAGMMGLRKWNITYQHHYDQARPTLEHRRFGAPSMTALLRIGKHLKNAGKCVESMRSPRASTQPEGFRRRIAWRRWRLPV
jgi:hypothetical protein